jgi:hypothetical protein
MYRMLREMRYYAYLGEATCQQKKPPERADKLYRYDGAQLVNSTPGDRETQNPRRRVMCDGHGNEVMKSCSEKKPDAQR